MVFEAEALPPPNYRLMTLATAHRAGLWWDVLTPELVVQLVTNDHSISRCSGYGLRHRRHDPSKSGVVRINPRIVSQEMLDRSRERT